MPPPAMIARNPRMKNLGTIVTLSIVLGAFLVGYGMLRESVATNTRRITVLQSESAKRLEILYEMGKIQARIAEQLVGLEKRVGKVEEK